MSELAVIRFCAEEVERQRRGPIQVWWMYEAWLDALRRYEAAVWHSTGTPSIGLWTVQTWGHLIERDTNVPVPDGEYIPKWRGVGVRVGPRICPSPSEVPHLMARWSSNLDTMTPAEAYKEFEEIHPFADGNGRTGKVIFNWLNATLSSPVLPPNFWGGIP